MIKINDVEINCLISFSISTENDKLYEESAVDGTLLMSHRMWRDNLSITLAPKIQSDHDLIVETIRNTSGMVTITYPVTTSKMEKKIFLIDSLSYNVERLKSNDYRFSVISISAKQQSPLKVSTPTPTE